MWLKKENKPSALLQRISHLLDASVWRPSSSSFASFLVFMHVCHVFFTGDIVQTTKGPSWALSPGAESRLVFQSHE